MSQEPHSPRQAAPLDTPRQPGVIIVLAGKGPFRWACYVIAVWLLVFGAAFVIGFFASDPSWVDVVTRPGKNLVVGFGLMAFALGLVRWARTQR